MPFDPATATLDAAPETAFDPATAKLDEESSDNLKARMQAAGSGKSERHASLTTPEEPSTAEISPWEAANTPLVKIPDVSVPDHPWLEGLVNGINDVTSSFSSPLGAATVGGIGALGDAAKAGDQAAKAVLTAIKGVFAAQAAKGLGEGAAKAIYDTTDTDANRVRAAASSTVNAGFAIGMAKEVKGDVEDLVNKAREGGVIPKAEPVSSPVAEPKTGETTFDPKTATLDTPDTSVATETAAGPPAGEPAAASEPNEYGIAARVTEQRAAQGQVKPVDPGEVMSGEESVEYGRKLIEQGADPEAVLNKFEDTGDLPKDAFSIVRARGEQLAKTASDVSEEKGWDSPEAVAARKADSDWIARVKPLQTAWAEHGQAMQGSTDIDTGDFYSLRKAFMEETGRDFTPDQVESAKRVAETVRDAEQQAETSKQKVFDSIKNQPGSVGDIWKRAKAYLDSGETDFDDIRHKIARDTGMPVQEVTRLLTEPKTSRVITNEMWSKAAMRRRIVQQAHLWLADQARPGWRNVAAALPRAFFAMKVAGHQTVGMVTHAGTNAFDPGAWSTYWPNFFKQFKLSYGHDAASFHEMTMQDLVRDPNFVTARRAGLANDPYRYTDDYQRAWLGRVAQKYGLIGNRGFDALKLFRQDRFNQAWDGMTPGERTTEAAKMLANEINHSTGTINSRIPGWIDKPLTTTFFAPRLEGSRWAWLISDPAKAAQTFVDWKNASPADRMFAMRQLKQKAGIAGTYLGLLAINQSMLTAARSGQKINFTDPRRSDFLSFKILGHNVGVVSPTIGIVRLVANMLHASQGNRTNLEQLDSRYESMGKVAVSYARAKASPFAGFVTDMVSQADYQNRPMPFSSDRVPAYLRREGVGKYGYGEYAGQEFTPIPISEAVKEVWAKQGMNESTATHWISALAAAAAMASTGIRVSKDYRDSGEAPNPGQDVLGAGN